MKTALDYLLADLGMHYAWTWCRHRREYVWLELWWWPPLRSPGIAGPQRVGRRRRNYYSGMMSERRGRHWNRKRGRT